MNYRKHPKGQLHERNFHQGRYPLEELSKKLPELGDYLFTNPFGDLTLDFANPEAVKLLNKALLKHYYEIDFWDIPDGFLCPPIPGRADYLHYLADLLKESNGGKFPKNGSIKVLDIGTGANVIYPILGSVIYNWSFIGSEINLPAVDSATQVIEKNSVLQDKVNVRLQANPQKIFHGIIESGEFFDLTLCNPPFHDSDISAKMVNQKKMKGLTGVFTSDRKLNFGGQAQELWTTGGELEFIRKMIFESISFKNQVFWFSCLVSKSENLPIIQKFLETSGIASQKIVSMAQGNKISRFIAWTFLTDKQQVSWKKFRWS
jgi:23S rRNA (adenine1618-N6)-methyltransferase